MARFNKNKIKFLKDIAEFFGVKREIVYRVMARSGIKRARNYSEEELRTIFKQVDAWIIDRDGKREIKVAPELIDKQIEPFPNKALIIEPSAYLEERLKTARLLYADTLLDLDIMKAGIANSKDKKITVAFIREKSNLKQLISKQNKLINELEDRLGEDEKQSNGLFVDVNA
jgi:hypothetical protein